jgi:hypothetical protein
MEIVEGLLVRLEKSKSKGKRKSIANSPITPALSIATANSVTPSEPPGSSHDSLFTPQSPPTESPKTTQSEAAEVLRDRVLGDGHQVYNAYWYPLAFMVLMIVFNAPLTKGFMRAKRNLPHIHTSITILKRVAQSFTQT